MLFLGTRVGNESLIRPTKVSSRRLCIGRILQVLISTNKEEGSLSFILNLTFLYSEVDALWLFSFGLVLQFGLFVTFKKLSALGGSPAPALIVFSRIRSCLATFHLDYFSQLWSGLVFFFWPDQAISGRNWSLSV